MPVTYKDPSAASHPYRSTTPLASSKQEFHALLALLRPLTSLTVPAFPSGEPVPYVRGHTALGRAVLRRPYPVALTSFVQPHG